MTTATPTKYESKKEPGLFYWVEPLTLGKLTTYSVVAQQTGGEPTEALDDWFANADAADRAARDLAEGRE